MELRFIIRDGKKILQQKIEIKISPQYCAILKKQAYKIDWQDVPLVEEGK